MTMELSLTRRQTQILEVIRREVLERGYPPTIREIGARVGLSSSSTVHCHLRNLEDKGFIRRDPARPRCIEILSDPRKWALGADDASAEVEGEGSAVAREAARGAGHGEDATGPYPPGIAFYPVLEDPSLLPRGAQPVLVPLPRDLVGGDDAFLFQVEGDSMREAAIMHGDLVIAQRKDQAEDGDIVVALVNQEITVKRYFHGSGFARLEPENRRMKPIFARDVRILGKVVALIRRIY